MSKIYTIDLNKTKRKRKVNKKLRKRLLVAFVFITICLLAGGYFLKKFAASYEGGIPIINPLINTIEPKLEQDNGLTNILILGIDTRESNHGLMNTDTIIILTIDHENKTAMMTSIPRDLWTTFTLPNGRTASAKINSAYAYGEWHGQNKGYGIATLKGAVENIIGQPIHYHVKVTLSGFVKIIDAIGGVDIEIPEYYVDAYPYEELPYEYQQTCNNFYYDGHFCKFEFQKGVQHMDGQMALIYARSRILAPKGDFERAEKQQRVVNAVKDKILSTQTLLDASKLWELYKIFEQDIETSSFTINDVRAVLNLRDEIDPKKIGKVVLDPYFGHTPGKYIYRPTAYPSRGYYIEARDPSYQSIQQVLEKIRRNPLIYNEEAKISIYNATGVYALQTDFAAEIEADNPFFLFQNTNKVIANPDNMYKNISIYRFCEEPKPETEEYLKNFFNVDILTEFDDGTRNLLGEDYVVIVGPSGD